MLGVVDFEQHELQYLDSIPISKTSPISAHGPHFVFNVCLLYSCGTCTHDPPTDRFNWDHWKKSVVVTVSPTFSLQYHVLSKFSQSGNNTTTMTVGSGWWWIFKQSIKDFLLLQQGQRQTHFDCGFRIRSFLWILNVFSLHPSDLCCNRQVNWTLWYNGWLLHVVGSQ